MRIFKAVWPSIGSGGSPHDIEVGMRVYATAQTNAGSTHQHSNWMKNVIRRDVPLRLLLSYHYYKDQDVQEVIDIFKGHQLDLFADSGAWSAWSIGQPIDEGAYIAWVERWGHLFSAIAGPDVIGDAKATRAATERMIKRLEKKRWSILPTFHVGEDWGYLKDYAAMSDYIAFGGMVPFTREKELLRKWCAKAFSVAGPVKVHGFGMTTWTLLCAFPWYSVDSSSWSSGFRYATLQLFDSRRGRMTVVSMGDKKSILANADLLAEYNLRPSESRAANYDRERICGVSIEAWQRAELWLTHQRERRAERNAT